MESPRGPTMSLPGDIIRLVFDGLPLSTLIFASHVCKEWRVIAHAHPTFSRNIDYFCGIATSPPAFHADLLTARVMATGGTLNLTFYVSQFPHFTNEVVLPLLAQCLHRVVDLRVMVDGSSASDLLLVLERPAPRLAFLRMGAIDSDNCIDLDLSPRFLGGSVTRLETLYTHGFTCAPSVTAIPAFAATKRLIYESSFDPDPHCTAVQRMLSFLPSLEKIHMSGCAWPGDWCDYRISAPLRSLDIHIDAPLMPAPLLAAFSSPDLVYMSVEGPRVGAETFAIMVHPLDNDLTLEVAWRDEQCCSWALRLRDERRRVRQMFFHEPPGTPNYGDISNLIPLYRTISHRITSVSLSIALWDSLVELVTDLPTLTTLALSVWDIRDSIVLTPIGCPKLKTLDMWSVNRAPVDVTWLAKFLGHTLGCAARARLTLRLRGCQLDGDPDMVWGYCDEIRLLRP